MDNMKSASRTQHALSSIGSGIAGSGGLGTQRDSTLMERLSQASFALDTMLTDVDRFLSRINGGPETAEKAVNHAGPVPTRPLGMLVQSTEAQVDRLREIIQTLERIG